MHTAPRDLTLRLRQHHQEHILTGWDRLTEAERAAFVAQLQALDLEELQRLYAAHDQPATLPAPAQIEPVPVARLEAASRAFGEELLQQGKVAALLVAGGQGTRLGFDQPKGMFPVGPVSNKSLFQVFAEKVLALRRRYGRSVPFLILTSDATHADTTAFFAEYRHFGLPADEVYFFQQGTMPALDLATGRLLLEQPGRLATSPDGHGGTLTALVQSGLLEELSRQQIEEVFYFQVDNPLVRLADPAFLGQHRAARAEVSTKVVAKLDPTERTGNLVMVDGRCLIIEYSDLPEELARQTDEHGRLRIWAGNTAIHLFNVAFLARVTAAAANLPFHIARKKVPYVADSGQLVQPARENALKFERFIFDVLPLAERWTVVETSRREEFEPLKNATGPNSPETVRRALRDLAADWLERAGVAVPADTLVEISPLLALDAEELAARIENGVQVDGSLYLR